MKPSLSNWCLTKTSLNVIDSFPHLPDRRMQCGVDTNMFGKITEIPLPGHTNTFYHHIKPGNSFCVLKHEKNCKCCLVLLLLPSGQIEIIVINSVSKKQLSLTQFRITLTIGQLSLSSNFGLKWRVILRSRHIVYCKLDIKSPMASVETLNIKKIVIRS